MAAAPRLRPSRRLAAGSAALAATFLLGAVVAAAAGPAIQTFTPRSERQITNIDVLRQQIRNYYGDPLGTGTFASDSNYAKEASKVARAGTRWLDARAHRGITLHQTTPKIRAIILDVDDTS